MCSTFEHEMNKNKKELEYRKNEDMPGKSLFSRSATQVRKIGFVLGREFQNLHEKAIDRENPDGVIELKL